MHLTFAWRVLWSFVFIFLFYYFGVCVVIFVVDWWFADTFGVCLEDFVIDWCFFVLLILFGGLCGGFYG